MKKKKFSEEQIIRILKEGETGVSVAEIARKYGFSENSFYRWRAKYHGMNAEQLKQLKALEEENRRLKTAVADLTLDNQMLKAINEKKW